MITNMFTKYTKFVNSVQGVGSSENTVQIIRLTIYLTLVFLLSFGVICPVLVSASSTLLVMLGFIIFLLTIIIGTDGIIRLYSCIHNV